MTGFKTFLNIFSIGLLRYTSLLEPGSHTNAENSQFVLAVPAPDVTSAPVEPSSCYSYTVTTPYTGPGTCSPHLSPILTDN